MTVMTATEVMIIKIKEYLIGITFLFETFTCYDIIEFF